MYGVGLSQLINTFLNMSMALLILCQALSFAWKKQEMGVVYVRFGPVVNIAALFIVGFVTQLLTYSIEEVQQLGIELIIFAFALLGGIYLSLQRIEIAENGIAAPPLFIYKWEEIASYAWGEPLRNNGKERLTLSIMRRLLIYRWTGSRVLEVPGDMKKKVSTLLKLYLPFKEEVEAPPAAGPLPHR